jgi:hypothetical protein
MMLRPCHTSEDYLAIVICLLDLGDSIMFIFCYGSALHVVTRLKHILSFFFVFFSEPVSVLSFKWLSKQIMPKVTYLYCQFVKLILRNYGFTYVLSGRLLLFLT